MRLTKQMFGETMLSFHPRKKNYFEITSFHWFQNIGVFWGYLNFRPVKYVIKKDIKSEITKRNRNANNKFSKLRQSQEVADFPVWTEGLTTV